MNFDDQSADESVATSDEDPRGRVQVYVFALLAHQVQATLDPLDLEQWEFYVVPTAVLDGRERSRHSITLPSLQALHGEPVGFHELRKAVGAV